jgi:hypothetical protein
LLVNIPKITSYKNTENGLRFLELFEKMNDLITYQVTVPKLLYLFRFIDGILNFIDNFIYLIHILLMNLVKKFR